jgi:hypothetical protein
MAKIKGTSRLLIVHCPARFFSALIPDAAGDNSNIRPFNDPL